MLAGLVAGGDALAQGFGIGGEEKKGQRWMCSEENIPVALFQGGAGDESRARFIRLSPDELSDGFQPILPIRIGQCDACGHFLPIASGVKIITIEKPSAGRISEGLAQSGLAHRSNAHEDEDVGFHHRKIFYHRDTENTEVIFI